MNSHPLLRAAAPIAVIVLSTGAGAADCERQRAQNEREYNSRSTSRVEIRADDDTCWTASLDGRTQRGCGDATLYGHGTKSSTQEARVTRTSGDGTVRTSLVVDGRTVDRASVRDAGGTVVVRQEVHAG